MEPTTQSAQAGHQDEPRPDQPSDQPAGPLALVMSGGGARAAYQAGFLRGLGERMPDLELPILTGVSAGAINAAFLAAAEGNLRERTTSLCDLWKSLEINDVLDTRPYELLRIVGGWGVKLATGGRFGRKRRQGFVDTGPLQETLARHLKPEADGSLPGVTERIANGTLQALAVTGSSYTSGKSVTWVQGSRIQDWERPTRRSVATPIRIEHVMASAALPFLFPPVRVEDAWFGDGGIRLTAPLAPAVHLGAGRLLALSTRFRGAAAGPEVDDEVGEDPPPAQIGGTLLNAIFLDLVDQDALNMARLNRLIHRLPPEKRGGLRPVDLAVVRPSRDLGKLANDHEARLPKGLRFLTRGWGTRETRSNDLLSLLMFQPDYLSRLVDLGRSDADQLAPEMEPFLLGRSDYSRRTL